MSCRLAAAGPIGLAQGEPMTDEIDWPMTVGTVVLAAFLAWVVLAMYRPPQQAFEAWARSGHVAQGHAAHAAQRPSLPARRP